MLGEGQGNETLTGSNLANLSGILTSDTDRFGAELRQARVVNDQHSVLAAQHLFSPLCQEGLQGTGGPGTVGDELLNVVFLSRCHDSCQGLHAFSMSRTAQSSYIQRCPVTLGPVTEVRQEGRKPSRKVSGPGWQRTWHSKESSITDAGLLAPDLNIPKVQLEPVR